MKIGILQTGLVAPELAQEHGEYPDMFMRLLGGHGFDFETWSVVRDDFPERPEAAEGWLITGSKFGAYEDHPWIQRLEQLIRDIVAADKPLVGICFGHQIMAQALGGRVEKFSGGWAIGPQTYEFADGPRTVQAWHQDQVTQAPEGAETVASNDFCRHAALLYPGKAYSVQAHPEIEAPYALGLVEVRGPGLIPEAQLAAARANIDMPLQSADLADQFARFFRDRRIS